MSATLSGSSAPASVAGSPTGLVASSAAGLSSVEVLRLKQQDRLGAWLQVRWLLPVLIALVVFVMAIILFWHVLNPSANREEQATTYITVGFSVVLAAMLSVLPAALCGVQNISRRRQLARLESFAGSRAAETSCYKTAKKAIDYVRVMAQGEFAMPIFVYFLMSFIGFIAIFLGYGHRDYFGEPTILLGGLIDPQTTERNYALYQMQTFAAIGMAFIGSYVYAIGRLLDRLNNSDLYPISLYYYAVRFIIAGTSAAVLRHTIALFDGSYTDASNLTQPTVILLSFVIGFAPDLFIVAISRKAFQIVKIWGTRSDPAGDDKPTSMPLLMIDDITRDKVDRLNELGIDSAQILARQNPFMLLPRLPYELSLLVDWIAQAQLYVLVKDATLQRLRTACIRDIVDLHIRLGDAASRAATCGLLGRPETDAAALLAQLETDTNFLQLRELIVALNQSALLPIGAGQAVGTSQAIGAMPQGVSSVGTSPAVVPQMEVPTAVPATVVAPPAAVVAMAVPQVVSTPAVAPASSAVPLSTAPLSAVPTAVPQNR